MADRYWVGGTAAWDGTAGTKWALTSGGAGGQAVPTSADDVFFNAASGAVTCTISTGNTGAKSVTCTGFTGTLAGTANISVSGSVTLVAGMTFTYSGTLTIAATGTLTTAGKTLSSIILNASVTLGDALLTTTGAALTLNSGNFDLNGFTCSVGVFSSSGSGVRSIAFGAQNIALTATTPVSVTILGMAIATNFTFTGTGGFSRNSVQVSNIFFGSTSGATSTNAPNLFVVAGASGITFNTSHFKTINFTGSTCTISGLATLYSSPTLAAGGTYTGFTLSYTTTQTLTTSGKTIGALQVVGSGITLTLGGALTTATNGSVTLLNGTLDLNGFPMSTGSFISSGSLARSIVFGTQNIALTSTTAATTVLSMANMSGFSYTGTGGFTRNNTVTATASCGNNGGGSAANAPNLSITGGSATFSISTSVGPVGSFFNNLICTGFNGLLAVVPSSGIYVVNIAGSFTASNFTNNDVSPTFIGTGTLTTGATSILNVLIDATAGTITLGSALSCGSIVQNGGTFTTSNFNVTAFDISSGGVAAKVMNFGSSTITITDRTFNLGASNLTVNAGTSIISMAGAGLDKTFTGGSKTYYELRQSGVGILIIVGSNTFNDLTSTATGTTSILFAAGATQTFANFSVSGTAPYSVGIESATRGSTFTLSKASGTVNASRLFIRDSVATGGATWNATNSLSLGGNTGWNITASVGRYWVGGSSSWDGTAGTKWATSSGGAGGATVPGFVDPVYFDAASGANTVTVAAGNFGCNGIACTGFTGTLTGTSSLFTSGNITLVAGMTFSYSGTLTVSVGSVITSAGKTFGGITFNATFDTLTLADNLTLTGQFGLSSGTLNLANFTLSTGIFSSSNSSVRSISFGSGNIALTSTTAAAVVLSMSTASNFTWTGTGGFTRNQAATATITFGFTGGSNSNAPNLAVNAGTSTLTISSATYLKNLNFTGSACSVVGSAANISGNLTLSSDVSADYTGLVPVYRGSGTITSNGKALGGIAIINPSNTATLADALSIGGNTFTHTSGTFTTSGFNVTAGRYESSNTNVRALNLGSSTITLTGGGAGVFLLSNITNMTLNAGASTISLSSGSAKQFSGGGLTYHNLNNSGLGTMTVIGSNTFNDILNTVKFNRIVFTAGTTQTLSNFSFTGLAGQPADISSSSPGSQYNLSKASGIVSVDYLGIEDSNATGGAAWYAGANSTNISNNTGWIFTAVPKAGMFLMFV